MKCRCGIYTHASFALANSELMLLTAHRAVMQDLSLPADAQSMRTHCQQLAGLECLRRNYSSGTAGMLLKCCGSVAQKYNSCAVQVL